MPKFQPPKNLPAKTGAGKILAPLIVEPKCLVCKNASYRPLVDEMLVKGFSYSEIERQFAFIGLKRRSIASHKEKHLGYADAAIRQVIEREATAAMINYDEGVDRLVTKHSYLEVALQKAYDALTNDEVVVEPKDAVKVIESLQRLQEESQIVAVDELRVQFQMFLQAVKEIVPTDNWEQIVMRTEKLLRNTGRQVDFGEPKELEPADAEVVSP